MMLSEKKLTVACVIIAVIGIAAIFTIARISEPPQTGVSEALESSGKVKIRGFVDSVDIYESRAIIKLASLETVEAISFDSGYVKRLGLQRFGEVEVDGELRDYKGSTSLIISRLKRLNGSICENGN